MHVISARPFENYLCERFPCKNIFNNNNNNNPIFHRTSVTKRKLASLLALLIVIEVLISASAIIRTEIAVAISLIVYAPPMLFFNFKLFIISGKKANNHMADDKKKTFALKNVSSCLLVVISLVVLSIPSIAYVAVAMNSEKSTALDVVDVVGQWAKTTVSMNSTFNC